MEKSQFKDKLPDEKWRPTFTEIVKILPDIFRLLYQIYPAAVIGMVAIAIIDGLSTTAYVYAVKQLTDCLTSGSLPESFPWLALIVGIEIVGLITGIVSDNLAETQRLRLDYSIDDRTLEAVSNLVPWVYEDPGMHAIHDMYRRHGYKILTIQQAAIQIPSALLRLLGALALVTYVPWYCWLFVVLGVIIRLVLKRKEAERRWSLRNVENRLARRSNMLRWWLTSPRAAQQSKQMGIRDHLLSSWRAMRRQLLIDELALIKLRSKTAVLSDGLRILAFIVGLSGIIYGAYRGYIALSIVVTFVMVFGRIGSSISQLLGSVNRLQQDMIFMPILNLLDELPKEVDRGVEAPQGPLTIEFRGVSFIYPGESKFALNDLDLVLKPGEHISLVGLNGAGKTTFIKLLCGFYHPTTGQILVNGLDLKTIRPDSWRKRMSTMAQQRTRYEGTIKDLVLLADTEHPCDGARLALASSVSGLDLVIEKEKLAWDSYIGKESSMPEDDPKELSGGQHTSIEIARCLYPNRALYLLDEVTVWVDIDKVDVFLDGFHKLTGDATVIFASHDFNTTFVSSRVLVFDKGRLVEDGSVRSLLGQNGVYRMLYDKWDKRRRLAVGMDPGLAPCALN